MAVSASALANDIFKVTKSFGHTVQLFTTAGASEVDPENARRFYIKDINTMITIEDEESPFEVKVNIGKGIEVKDIRDMLDTLRTVANKSLAEYTLRTFGKHLEPKDFAYQAKASAKVSESISKAYGTKKSSYQALENARLVIKHRVAVDEEKRGSRSRNIKAIYVEADKERTLLPHTNLSAARATLQHVKQGGNLVDEIAEHINALVSEQANLYKFSKYAKQHSLVSEDTAEVYDSVKERMKAIRKTFKQLSGTKGYKAYTENYANEANEIDDNLVSDLRDQFTVRLFDETVADALPHVAQLVNENSAKKRRTEALHNLINKVTSSQSITLRNALDTTDPSYPANMNFSSPTAEASITAGYLASYIADDELANMLGQLSDDIHELSAKEQTVAIKAVQYVFKKANVTESVQSEAVCEATQDIENALSVFSEAHIFRL